jgi:hypothetical protein
MRVTESRVRYEADGQPLLVSEYNCSVVLPPHHYGGLLHGIGSIFVVASETLEGEATLYLSKAGDRLIRGWVEESWEARQSQLNLEGTEPFAGTALNRFSSSSHVGFKARVEDVFQNRVGLLVAGPRSSGPEVSQLARRLLGSIEFHDDRPLDDSLLIDAVTAYLNASAQTGADVFLCIARLPYLARPMVIEALRRLVQQMRVERHPEAEYGARRLELLEKAREAMDAGVWTEAVAELRDQL